MKHAVADAVPVGENTRLPTAVSIVTPVCSPPAPICLNVVLGMVTEMSPFQAVLLEPGAMMVTLVDRVTASPREYCNKL